jgi:hypothetical protein
MARYSLPFEDWGVDMPASHAWERPAAHYDQDVVTDWPRGPRPSGAVRNDAPKGKNRSVGRRTTRAAVRFFIAILIGVSATLAWQSYGDELKEMVGAWAPSLAWLLPVSTKSSRDVQELTAAAVTSDELAQQLKPVALDLANLRQGVDQLAIAIKQLSAKQEKMAQDIAILPAIEQDMREKLAPPPQPRTVAPRRTPPQSTGQPDIPAPSAR